MNKTVFIGHRQIFANTLSERLTEAITKQIQNGCINFTMGSHGDFDNLALSCCQKLHSIYPDINIELVITSLNGIKTNCAATDGSSPFFGVKTVMFDIEETHYKRQITLSNQKMIDGCDTMICYVDEKTYRSGAKTALNYAKRKGLRIINLYLEEDTTFYGMTQEEIKDYLDAQYAKVFGKKQ